LWPRGPHGPLDRHKTAPLFLVSACRGWFFDRGRPQRSRRLGLCVRRLPGARPPRPHSSSHTHAVLGSEDLRRWHPSGPGCLVRNAALVAVWIGMFVGDPVHFGLFPCVQTTISRPEMLLLFFLVLVFRPIFRSKFSDELPLRKECPFHLDPFR
jgi:hypothetical protein